MEIKTSKGVYCVNADYTIEEKQGEYPKLTCTIPATKNKTWIDDCKELDRLYTPGEQDEFVIINPVKITKGDSYDLEITAVGAFEFDFVKSRIDDNLPTHSYAVEYLLDLVFKDTRYSYDLQGTYEKREFTNFGSDNRYKLFLQIMNRFNLEFKIIGKIVRINSKIGNDTGFQFRYLKNIKDTKYSVDATNLVTHVKGYGAYHDANDQSKGRLEVEYLSPLSDIYGKLSGEPVVDERMSISATLLEKCKQSVESSVAVTVSTTLVALKNQEYRGVARIGDSIWFIDERIELEKKIRFSTVKSYYDAFDELIKQDVQLGDKDVFSRAQSSDSASHSKLIDMQKELSDQLADVEDAIKKTYVMPSGVNRVFYSSDLPEDVPKGTIKEGDTLFRNIDGETKMYRWDGVQWELVPVVNDVEKFREELNNEIAQVNQSMQAQSEEHDRQVADILSKTHSVESLANQAKSDVASAIARANQVKTEAIADARAQVATVSQALNTAKSELQSAIASADQKARDSQASATALRNDLNLQTSKILAQAQAQTDLTNRVSTVETLADGTRSTVAELSKTLSKATGDITSVTSRTKSVEDTLSQTRTQYEALTQTVNTQTGQIDSINRKTVDLQSGIDGVTQRFENLRVGATNYIRDFGFAISHTFMNYRSAWRYERIADPTAHSGYHIKATCTQAGGGGFYERFFDLKGAEWQGRTMTYAIDIKCSKPVRILFAPEAFDDYATQIANVNVEWQRFISSKKVRFRVNNAYTFYIHGGQWQVGDVVYIRDPQLEDGTMATTPSPAPEDQQSYADTKIAEYKHTVDGRFATIQSSVDNKANLIDFQRVQETAKLYERILGASENEVNSNLARQVLTSSLWQTEITRLPRAGGKNYFLNSNFKEGLQFWENNTSSPDLSIDPQLASQVKRVGALHVDTGNTGAFAHGFYQIVDMPVSANEQVTVSFDVAAFPNNDAGLIIIVNNHLFDVRKEIPAAEIPKTNSFGPTSLKRKAVTLTIPNDCDRICCIIIFGPGTVGNMVFADMQIEKGGAASDYRPNPTDANRELEAVTTRVTQLAGAWAVKNLTSSGKVLNQLNLNKDGSVKIDGSLVQITGRTYIQDGIISAAKIGDLDAGKIKTGTLDAARIRANSIDGSKIVFDQAFLNKMTASEAYLQQLFAKDAFLTAVQAVSISASQITGGLMRATNGAMEINFNNSAIDMFKDGAIRFHSGSNAIYRQSTDGIHTAFMHFDTTSREGIYASLGSTSSRDGINSKSSGRFAGIRVARTSERSDSHIASQDAVELYGDTIFFGHSFEGGGFSMHTTLTGGRTISLNKMHDALINLCRCWIHLRNVGFDLNSSAFRKALDTEIHNAQQLYNTIERIT